MKNLLPLLRRGAFRDAEIGPSDEFIYRKIQEARKQRRSRRLKSPEQIRAQVLRMLQRKDLQ